MSDIILPPGVDAPEPQQPFIAEGVVDAFEAVDSIEMESKEDQLARLDGVTSCPACGSASKHTYRDMPFQKFVYRVFWCKSVLDEEGLHPSNKCNTRVRRNEEREAKRGSAGD